LYQDKLTDARRHFEIALQLNRNLVEAHQGLATVFQRLGDEKNALLHRNSGFKNQAISTLNYRGQGTPVQLLVLSSARDGNIPWRLLIDRGIFHTTLLAVDYFDAPLPPHQLVFNAIGDADLCEDELRKACHLLKNSRLPVINSPDNVLKTGRLMNAKRLANIPNVALPRMMLISRTDFLNGHALKILDEQALTPPLLLRSPGFHGGNYFVRVDKLDELNSAAEKLPGESLLAIEFLDSGNPDGLYRKYRVMCIDGKLYPIHLAISTRWNVHYFSADMAENERYRIEEANFLNDISTCLGQKAISALNRISQILALDYCGIDFGLDAENNILVYEANSTMVINPPTHEAQWDYRRTAIDNALTAAKQMFIERVRGFKLA
jgi:glutathione synthase/RimK-type ligase-like ATP-grasp enzyme